MTKAKKKPELKRFLVTRIDESYCYVMALSPMGAIFASNDGDAPWEVNIGETEAEEVKE